MFLFQNGITELPDLKELSNKDTNVAIFVILNKLYVKKDSNLSVASQLHLQFNQKIYSLFFL